MFRSIQVLLYVVLVRRERLGSSAPALAGSGIGLIIAAVFARRPDRPEGQGIAPRI